ncbi:acyl carrier protein [Nitrosomonas sp.]|uniref:acyl carrier protein n=1 Tax=Nitrosomonas sp. TaxID=42353 RepID=UPI001DBA346C|nr:phosphopantetheine-binding protein [Nitrosomonas sp.]MCB1948001.1 acyl carrier protein [Nitrosomonas sp.]MCP5243864.1 acyl carrier protein [Burkholderiales bacterium]MDR4513489.1 phosphopantetheine-binding protein [Nitrosomonas sp.]
MNTENIEAKVIEFIASKVEDVDASSITAASEFEALGLDSMDRVQLLFDAEETFGVTFEDDEVKDFHCVKDIIDYINNHQPSSSSSEND